MTTTSVTETLTTAPPAEGSIRIRKLTEHIGAEVTGVDLTKPVDEKTKRLLNDAMVEHIALVIRDQEFTPDQFTEAARVFGVPMPRPSGNGTLDDNPYVHTVSSRQVDAEGNSLKTGVRWHTDHTNLVAPSKYTMLYAVELPVSGGGTSVCSMRAAYAALTDAQKQRFGEMKTANVILGSAVRDYGRGMANIRANQDRVKPEPVIHPLVVTHPVHGTKALFFNPLKTENILGMSPEDTQDFFEDLIDEVTRPEFIYTHEWRLGDMFLWDNRASLHRAGSDYEVVDGRHRTLMRIIVEGDPLG